VVVVKRCARVVGVAIEGCCPSMRGHIAKKGFMPDYLVWHQHGEVQPPVATESDGNDDEDQMDDMIADIDIKYDLGSRD
jgi:hypothetical protein